MVRTSNQNIVEPILSLCGGSRIVMEGPPSSRPTASRRRLPHGKVKQKQAPSSSNSKVLSCGFSFIFMSTSVLFVSVFVFAHSVLCWGFLFVFMFRFAFELIFLSYNRSCGCLVLCPGIDAGTGRYGPSVRPAFNYGSWGRWQKNAQVPRRAWVLKLHFGAINILPPTSIKLPANANFFKIDTLA